MAERSSVKPAPCFRFEPVRGTSGLAWRVVKWRRALGVVRRRGRGWTVDGHGPRRLGTRQAAAEALLDQPWLREWLEAGRPTFVEGAEAFDDDAWMG